jgi:hypothetical protein
MKNHILRLILRGIILGVLYLEITQVNDTTPYNIFLFSVFYTIMFSGAQVAGIDPNVVTTAFITKTVFTLVDERIKKKEKFTNVKRHSS